MTFLNRNNAKSQVAIAGFVFTVFLAFATHAREISVERDGEEVVGTDVTNSIEIARQNIADLCEIVITGQEAEDDTLTIDFSNGNPVPSDFGVTFNAGDGSDAIVLTGGSAVPITSILHKFNNATDGQIDIDSGVITYTGLEPITDDLGADTRTFEFDSANDVVAISPGGGGLVTISSQGTSESVDFALPNLGFSVDLVDGNDVLDFDSSAVPSSADLDIVLDGGSGTNILNFDAAGATVRHDMESGTILWGGQSKITYTNFGSVNITNSTAVVPTLSEWGIIVLTGLMTISFFRKARRLQASA